MPKVAFRLFVFILLLASVSGIGGIAAIIGIWNSSRTLIDIGVWTALVSSWILIWTLLIMLAGSR
jgi:hypothetical protein